MEGIRAARLSGFLICVQLRVVSETGMSEVAERIELAHSNDVDGIVILPSSRESNSVNPDAVASRRKIVEARKLIKSAWWESFSRLIEPIVGGERNANQSTEEKSGAPIEQESRANEGGVKVA